MSDKPQPDPEDIRVGATIRVLRQSRGLSVAELAALVGKSEPLVHAIERGTRHATRDVCRSAAEALRVPKAAIKVFDDEDEISDADNAA